jgi:glycosyltransferase involved in cell wall biosynthesis
MTWLLKHNPPQYPPVIPAIEDYIVRPHSPTRVEGGKRLRASPRLASRPDIPLVSIITIVYNGEKYIEQTIKSVINQSYNPIEYLIIDGGSTDSTLNIIRKFEARIDYWISEPDEGISDALNKGIALSSGEIIGLLHAGDWYSVDQIERGVNALIRSSADFVFGDLQFHNPDGTFKYRINGNADYAKVIYKIMPELNHPTVLVRRRVYEKIGLFDKNYHIAMDYEWFLRLHRQGGAGEYVKGVLGHMGIGGVSDVSYVKTLKEERDIAVRYGQAKWAANLFFGGRVIKVAVRRRLEAWAPEGLYRWLRKIINPRYSSPV